MYRNTSNRNPSKSIRCSVRRKCLSQLGKPSKNQNFKDYSSEAFRSQLKKHGQDYSAERIDVVFDTYKHKGLKAAARCKRGKDVRRKVQHDTVVPNNWRAFLRLGENKSELFPYLLSNQMATAGLIDQALICAFNDTCFSNNPDIDLTSMVPCNLEEADTRVFLHATNMAENGHQRVVIRTVDTDVLVITISTFDKLESFVEELWLDFRAEKNGKFYPVHDIYEELRKSKAMGLPFFHAFTGCDQVSFLSHVIKSSAWKVWKSYDEVTPYFAPLSNQPSLDEVQAAVPTLERFTVILYDRTSNSVTTNARRRDLFCKGRLIDNIPPTSAALITHALHSAYIAGHVWGQSTIPLAISC